jgi:hypothetical protein
MSTNNCILTFCPIPNFINIEILKKFVKADLEANKEYFDELNMSYKISDPKKAEWILSKSINNSKLVGNGHNNIDILVDKNIGIDVSVLTLNNMYTNEKSIIQNFSHTTDLDSLFKDLEGEKAVTIFKESFMKKYNAFIENDDKKDIYYIIFICNKQNIYLSCFKLNCDKISTMKFSCFTKSCKNISIDNFIDIKIGNVKLYKSKKRLELRLHKDIIVSQHSIQLF